MSDSFTIRAIGRVRSSRAEARDDGWDAETTFIDLDEAVLASSAVDGLEAFSHIEVVYLFHALDEGEVVTGARHPRGNRDWPKVGILAQRGRNRPNRIGVTACELLGVDGMTLGVRGLDAIDGTPVVDVKPVIREFLPRGEVTGPPWSEEIMAAYW